MPKAIAELAEDMLRNPERVAVTPVASTVERVSQRIIQVDRGAKPALLAKILKGEPVDRALVFTRTKHGADKVVKGLAKANIAAEAIHGNKSQNHRERTLAAFRSGTIRTLVATDIAARGIDVDGVSHVVNFDLPNVPETYVHRIGRTARAGSDGIAISLVDADEVAYLRDIEKLIRQALPREDQRTGDARTHAERTGDTRNHQSRSNDGRRHQPQSDGRRPRRPASQWRGARTCGCVAAAVAVGPCEWGAHAGPCGGIEGQKAREWRPPRPAAIGGASGLMAAMAMKAFRALRSWRAKAVRRVRPTSQGATEGAPQGAVPFEFAGTSPRRPATAALD